MQENHAAHDLFDCPERGYRVTGFECGEFSAAGACPEGCKRNSGLKKQDSKPNEDKFKEGPMPKSDGKIKTCSNCGYTGSPENDFHKKKSTPDGRDYWCKRCKKEQARGSKKPPAAAKAAAQENPPLPPFDKGGSPPPVKAAGQKIKKCQECVFCSDYFYNDDLYPPSYVCKFESIRFICKKSDIEKQNGPPEWCPMEHEANQESYFHDSKNPAETGQMVTGLEDIVLGNLRPGRVTVPEDIALETLRPCLEENEKEGCVILVNFIRHPELLAWLHKKSRAAFRFSDQQILALIAETMETERRLGIEEATDAGYCR